MKGSIRVFVGAGLFMVGFAIENLHLSAAVMLLGAAFMFWAAAAQSNWVK